ncbi:unnamed protein product [Microthlaspi erraticum]|uniref:Uncharacterized protein n=1 Tax=Microthlaspi erraticum TaxID=1685480 RepID=A0A6D2J577_9BRAS|nr:unnamed protein product [Microthlaspi erraticum]
MQSKSVCLSLSRREPLPLLSYHGPPSQASLSVGGPLRRRGICRRSPSFAVAAVQSLTSAVFIHLSALGVSVETLSDCESRFSSCGYSRPEKMKFNAANPTSQKKLENDDDQKLRSFYEKRLSQEVIGDALCEKDVGAIFSEVDKGKRESIERERVDRCVESESDSDDDDESDYLSRKPIGPVDPRFRWKESPNGGALIRVKVSPGVGVGGTDQEGVVKDVGDGSYAVTYVVPKRGNYMVSIECNGMPSWEVHFLSSLAKGLLQMD